MWCEQEGVNGGQASRSSSSTLSRRVHAWEGCGRGVWTRSVDEGVGRDQSTRARTLAGPWWQRRGATGTPCSPMHRPPTSSHLLGALHVSNETRQSSLNGLHCCQDAREGAAPGRGGDGGRRNGQGPDLAEMLGRARLLGGKKAPSPPPLQQYHPPLPFSLAHILLLAAEVQQRRWGPALNVNQLDLQEVSGWVGGGE